MDNDRIGNNSKWIVGVTNAITGVTFIVLAFSDVAAGAKIQLLYLMIGIICLNTSGAWLVALRSTQPYLRIPDCM